MSRIAVAGIYHETNSFAPHRADIEAFRRGGSLPGLTVGAAMVGRFENVNIPISGAIQTLERAGHDVTQIAWGNAVPSGPVTPEAYEHFSRIIVDGIAASLPLDGVYLDLHGAMIVEGVNDCNTHLVNKVRSRIGRNVPLVASFDLHGNLSEDLVSSVDALTVFRTYPHIDMAETGSRAARLLETVIARGRPLARTIRKQSFLIPLHAQSTNAHPAAGLYDLARSLSEGEGVEAVDIALGFPPSDIPESAPAVVACGTDSAAVDAAADELSTAFASKEADFALPLFDPDDAVRRAMANRRGGPVVIADTQDNPGAGGTGGAIGMLRALLNNDADAAVFAILYDPGSVDQAQQIGVGGRAVFSLGTESGTGDNQPVKAEFTVECLTDGKVKTTGPMYGGNTWDLGGIALLRCNGVRVILGKQRQQAADQSVIRHVGLDPRQQKILALKTTAHFRADFEELADEIIFAASPGVHLADLTQYNYTNLLPHIRLMPNGPTFGEINNK